MGAVKEHCVEYRSNLWVAESFATKGMVMKGVRRHARMRMSMVRYEYMHYFTCFTLATLAGTFLIRIFSKWALRTISCAFFSECTYLAFSTRCAIFIRYCALLAIVAFA